MKFMKKLIMVLLAVMMFGAPAFAVEYFSATGSGATSVEVDVHSRTQTGFLSGQGKIIVTHLVAYSDLIGADLEVKGYLPDSSLTTLSVATTAAQAVLTVASTLEFAAGDIIFIEDPADVDDFESAEILSMSTTEANVMTLLFNLSHGYPVGSKIFEIENVANYEPWAITPTLEVVFKEGTNLVNVPAGSPLSVRLTGTAACKVNVAGYKE